MEEASPSAPVRVWVLFGGDSEQRQASLRSGVNVWLKLAAAPDIQAEPFLLAPRLGGRRERERRRQLLKKRNEMLKLGIPEEDLFPELQLEAIRCALCCPDCCLAKCHSPSTMSITHIVMRFEQPLLCMLDTSLEEASLNHLRNGDAFNAGHGHAKQVHTRICLTHAPCTCQEPRAAGDGL